jgi:hypothetical protein
MSVTAITVTGTGVAGGIDYAGTYAPAGLDPVPVIIVDALVGSVVLATEEAETVGAGAFSGLLTVAAGTYELRAEAVGGAAAESDPVVVPNVGAGGVAIGGPVLAGTGSTAAPDDAVSALTVTGTGIGGGISYSGTYEPGGLAPPPVIIVDAMVGSVVFASEEADVVGAGAFSGVLLVEDGTYTLRAEAIGGAAAESEPVTVANAGTGGISIGGPALAGTGTTAAPGAGAGGITIGGPVLAGVGTTAAPGAGTGGVVIAAPGLAGVGTTMGPGVTVQPPPFVVAFEEKGLPVLEPKDPDDVIDYWFDWTEPLAGFPSDAIATVAWRAAPDVPAPLVIGAQAASGAALRGVFVSGGASGTEYRLTCTITTVAGRTLERSARLYVEER